MPRVLPAHGMAAIPLQLAAALPAGLVSLGCRVAALEGGGVRLQDGTLVPASAVIVATEGDVAARLLELPAPPRPRSALSLSYAAIKPPMRGRDLLLNGEGEGPVNSVVCPSELSSHYAPAGESLTTVGVIDAVSPDDGALDLAVRRQLTGWFGAEVATWRLLRVERIRYAQPDQLPTDLEPVAREVRLGGARYVAGDHRETASLHGALVSGRRAAEALLADRGAA